MLQALIGQKKAQTQKFLEDGTRIPVTQIVVTNGNVVVQSKTQEKEGYDSLQLGFGIAKHADKATLGHAKGASLTEASRFLREVRVDGEVPEKGSRIKPTDVFEAGDVVDVTGVSKGKGFAGVVKRHQFKGGPRTHGQSDRERAPGSIGQNTTPGRVYRGKRMAGRMGHENGTIKNLEVVEVGDDYILIKGLVPGAVNNLVMIKKVGVNKKFVPLYKDKVDESEAVESPIEESGVVEDAGSTSVSDDAAQAISETPTDESAQLSVSGQSESEEKPSEDVESASSSSKNESTPAVSEETSEPKKEEIENAS